MGLRELEIRPLLENEQKQELQSGTSSQVMVILSFLHFFLVGFSSILGLRGNLLGLPNSYPHGAFGGASLRGVREPPVTMYSASSS